MLLRYLAFALLLQPPPAAGAAAIPPSVTEPCKTKAGERIAFSTADPPGDVSLSGNPEVWLSTVISLASPRAEPYQLDAFDPALLAGSLPDGRMLLLCPRVDGKAFSVDSLVVAPQEYGQRLAYLKAPPPPAGVVPNLAGWSHRMSVPLSRTGHNYIGLWREADGSDGSLVAAYGSGPEASKPVVLGISPHSFRLLAVGLPALHGPWRDFALFTDSKPGEPMTIAWHVWEPREAPRRDRERRRRR